MNIHEHQAKKILKNYGIPVSKGVVILKFDEIESKIKQLKSKKFVLKAQIHAGGRGKAGGIKLVKTLEELQKESKKMFGKVLVTHQTGPGGKKVKRLYIEEASDISKEFYLSCLIDRENSKIAFISSTEGGMDIEKIAIETPEKIVTTKVELKNNLKQAWWKSIIYERDDVEGLDASILTSKEVLKHSGHEDTFSDPLVDCKSTRKKISLTLSQIISTTL